MSYIVGAQIVREVAGAVGDLMGVFHEPNAPVMLDVGNDMPVPVMADVNKASLNQAQARNNTTGPNQKYAALLAAEPKNASKTFSFATAHNAKADQKYVSMTSRQPHLEHSIGKVMARAPQARRGAHARSDTRSALAKSPHEREAQRHFMRVAQALAKTPAQKPMMVSPNMLPDAEKQKMLELAATQGKRIRGRNYAALRPETKAWDGVPAPTGFRRPMRPDNKPWAGLVSAPSFIYA